MSKWVAAALAAAGVSAASVGGVYLLKGAGKDKLEFASVNDFKKDSESISGAECVKKVFGSVEKPTGTNDITAISSSNVPASGTFFGTVSSGTEEEYKSCLKIQRERQEHKDGDSDKWTGKFTLMWTFMKGNEGFINFNVIETTKDTNAANKLKVTGVFYLVSKEADVWKIKHSKDVSENKYIETDLNKFPKKNDNFTTQGVSDANWGFIEDNGLSSICNTCEHKTDRAKVWTHTFIWKKTEDSNHPIIKDWSKDHEWWKDFYGEEWKPEEKMTNFKGQWS